MITLYTGERIERIGDRVMIAQDVKIYSANHSLAASERMKIVDGKMQLISIAEPVTISDLNEDHIRTPTGKDAWHPSTITSMLGNEKFCGDLLLQKYYTEDFLTHKTRKNDGKFPQYYVEDDQEFNI